MIYVLEGPDGTGKSTLAAEIGKQKSATVLHPYFNKSWDMEAYHTIFIQTAEQFDDAGISVVLDRWTPSEEVYAKVFRKGAAYNTDAMINYYNSFLKITWIYCRNDNAVTNHLKNKEVRDEMFESMEKVVEEFDQYIKDHKDLNWLEYDYDKVDMEEFVRNLP